MNQRERLRKAEMINSCCLILRENQCIETGEAVESTQMRFLGMTTQILILQTNNPPKR